MRFTRVCCFASCLFIMAAAVDGTIARLTALSGPALLTALRSDPQALGSTEGRRGLTRAVHTALVKRWSCDPAFSATMAHHLVVDVHPIFREGFRDVLQRSAGGRVAVSQFASINAMLSSHHRSEDTAVFPRLRRLHPEVARELAILESDHRGLVALEHKIAGGDFEALVEFVAALDDHLNREELLWVPFLMDGTGGI